jgi:hypothetical protein
MAKSVEMLERFDGLHFFNATVSCACDSILKFSKQSRLSVDLPDQLIYNSFEPLSRDC